MAKIIFCLPVLFPGIQAPIGLIILASQNHYFPGVEKGDTLELEYAAAYPGAFS